ncbi:MAG TPA: ABC transporter permease [Polyangia bacterium]|jgi:ABC-type transport system involved in multi-copper enzyme maturation permease subunit|nr:ABC transporter permease [Polyangia bacterium]
MTRIAALALNTFREAVRNKVLYVLLMFALVLLAFTYFFSQGAMNEQLRIIRDVGLVGIELVGALIAIFIGVNLVYKELDRKTVFALIPKPIHRWEFVLGKYLGMLVTLAVLMTIMAVTLFVVLAIGGSVFGGDNDNGTVLRAIVLVFGEVAVITAVAVLFSSFSSPILSGALTLGIFAVGHFTPELRELVAKIESTPLRLLVRGGMRLFPDLHLFYVSGSMVGGQHVSVHGPFVDWSYVAVAGAYGALYSAAAIVLAMIIFARRDFV